jgi:hypothetical protein
MQEPALQIQDKRLAYDFDRRDAELPVGTSVAAL